MDSISPSRFGIAMQPRVPGVPRIPRSTNRIHLGFSDEENFVEFDFQSQDSDSGIDYTQNEHQHGLRKKKRRHRIHRSEPTSMFLEWKNDQISTQDRFGEKIIEGLDEAEFKKLFTVESRCVFSEVTESKQLQAVVEPFLHLTEEQQKILMSDGKEEHKKEKVLSDEHPEQLFARIPAQGKALLLRRIKLYFVHHLEKEILAYITAQQKSFNPNYKLIFKFTDGFDRLLAHCICQYYSLQSNSYDTETGDRVTVIEMNPIVGIPKVLLSQFLNIHKEETMKEVNFVKLDSFNALEDDDEEFFERRHRPIYRKKKYRKRKTAKRASSTKKMSKI